jgi:hypothetical protein
VERVLSLIDGGWFDIVTFLVAVIVSVAKCKRHKHKFVSGQTGRDILHGIAIFPLFTLMISVFSKEALQSLFSSSRIILSVAGAVALFSVLEDEFDRGEQL